MSFNLCRHPPCSWHAPIKRVFAGCLEIKVHAVNLTSNSCFFQMGIIISKSCFKKNSPQKGIHSPSAMYGGLPHIFSYIFLYFPTLFPAIDQFIGNFPAISKDIKDSTKPSFVGSSLSNAAVSLAPHDWQLLSRPSKWRRLSNFTCAPLCHPKPWGTKWPVHQEKCWFYVYRSLWTS